MPRVSLCIPAPLGALVLYKVAFLNRKQAGRVSQKCCKTFSFLKAYMSKECG